MTNSPSFTFEEIEGYTGRAYAFALFIKYARHGARIVFAYVATAFLARKLRKLVILLSPKVIEKFSKEQALDLGESLQKVHALLVDIFTQRVPRSEETITLPRWLSLSLLKSTNGLEDILEDLALLHDTDFRSLINTAICDLKIKSDKLEAVQN